MFSRETTSRSLPCTTAPACFTIWTYRQFGPHRFPDRPILREPAPGQLWIAEMPAAKFGFEFGARMTVVRLPGGGLFLHSPIALTPELRRELDALGPVRCVIAPS